VERSARPRVDPPPYFVPGDVGIPKLRSGGCWARSSNRKCGAPTAGEQENLNEFKEIRRNQGVRANQFLPLFVILAESGLVMEVSMAISQWPIWYWNWHIIERLFPLTCSFWLDGRSKHTAEQARTRTCHIAPYGTDGKPQLCLATDCNAWRWTRHPLHWRNTFTRRRGRCATSDLRVLRA
jgi:hypothetical protein